MLPAIVVGVIAGGIVNMVFPVGIITIVLVVVLLAIIIATLVKFCGIVKSEREKFGPLFGKKEDKAVTEEIDGSLNM